MEESTRLLGANPQQYQLVLAIKGLPKDMEPTITHLAERMQLNHNSMVELADRCEEHNLLRRTRSAADRRQVSLSITSEGEALLRKLGVAARQELRDAGPILVEAILRLTGDGRAKDVKDIKAEPRPRTGGTKKSGP
jgi:DNA-binding MarR family transcriptional regulator